MDLVNNVAGKVRGAFRSRGASEESMALGDQKAEAAREEREAQELQERAGKKSRAVERIERAKQRVPARRGFAGRRGGQARRVRTRPGPGRLLHLRRLRCAAALFRPCRRRFG